MSSIVITLPKIENARQIRDILVRHGFTVDALCTTGAGALIEMNRLDCGIVICGYRFSDMYYTQLAESMPESFEILLIGSAQAVADCPSGLVSLTMPLKSYELINTVQMMLVQNARRYKKRKARPKVRDEKEKNYIQTAKRLLMERNHMSEEDAYRYIQKCSMDSGTNMVETAQMILMLIYEEL